MMAAIRSAFIRTAVILNNVLIASKISRLKIFEPASKTDMKGTLHFR